MLPGVIQTSLQVCHDLIDRVPAADLLPSIYCGLATSNELGLNTAPGGSGNDRLFDELGERFALPQNGLDVGSNLWLNTDGRKGRRTHRVSV